KFGRLPILDGGRYKPVSTYAGIHLSSANKRSDYYQQFYQEQKAANGKAQVDADGNPGREVVKTERRPAVHWLLNLLAEGDAPDKAGNPEQMCVFRIENDQVVEMLGLKQREGRRYTFEEIIGGSGWSGYVKKVMSARQRPEKERDLTDVKALELAGHLSRYAS